MWMCRRRLRARSARGVSSLSFSASSSSCFERLKVSLVERRSGQARDAIATAAVAMV